MSDTLEHTAQRIAEQGREALLSRLRPAFEQAAAAHTDVLQLDDERLDAMVQKAADNADGLQWRRALASVATEELGIGLGEALGHPAVARAQAIAGAPSYEESLAALGSDGPTAATAVEPGEPVEPVEPVESEESEESESETPPGTVELTAVHLQGVPDLEEEHAELDLRFSPEGFDVARGHEEVVGRLGWDDIRELEVPASRSRRRRRRPHLIVRTTMGEATFEVRSASADELRDQIWPLIDEHLHGVDRARPYYEN